MKFATAILILAALACDSENLNGQVSSEKATEVVANMDAQVDAIASQMEKTDLVLKELVYKAAKVQVELERDRALSEKAGKSISMLEQEIKVLEAAAGEIAPENAQTLAKNIELRQQAKKEAIETKENFETIIDARENTYKMIVMQIENIRVSKTQLGEKMNAMSQVLERLKSVELEEKANEMVADIQAKIETLEKEVSALETDGQKQEEEWIQLFNGKDLEGWTPKIKGYELGDNFGNTFRVEDGLLKVNYEAYTDGYKRKFGHLFFKDKYSHYIIRVEYRFVGQQVSGGPGWALRNSGVMLHCQDPSTMSKDQDFPVSIEMQLLGGDGTNPRTNANVCTPGTHIEMNGDLIKQHCRSSNSETYHGEQWVTVEVEVRGDEVVRHKIDGKTVLEYQKPQLDPNDGDAKKLIKNGDVTLNQGFISLQSESHPIEFRKVELKMLEK